MKSVDEVLREMTAQERDRLTEELERYRIEDTTTLDERLLTELIRAIEDM
jgi:hypothetical protein